MFLYLYLDISKGPPVQFPGRAQPPTSLGAPPGAPSAPSAPYPSMGSSNAPPTAFGMPQPYSQASTPYPTQPMHPVPGSIPMQTNTYPSQQMPYPSQPMSTCYPLSDQSAPFPYPRQQDYNVYPNIQTTPDAREYFSSMAPSLIRLDQVHTQLIQFHTKVKAIPGGRG